MINKEAAYKKISELVERFDEQFNSYKNPDYNETLTRRDFIDPFFKALGWDIDNEEGYAEAYREVIHEDKVKVGSATKAPDYSFRVGGGKRLFFVEAKKPSIVIKDDILPAYQVRRYGWSAKLAISIITDFEEFSVYDCTKKPLPNDKASVARIKYLTFHDYLKEFDFIWDTFSKERVLKGSFDKFIQSDTNKKGTTTVDKEFLQSLDKWRTYLATSISLRNKNLNEDEINFVVQQFIDRIIFLRIAEDRGVEVYGNLKYAIKQGDYYKNLFELYQKADEKYNSGLFDFKKDQISKDLVIDNKVIKSIINELYYPECPYEFSVLAVEILGSAYEQFLGKVIRITKAHHAIIEEKPEVRKAGGVYYTPQYIVEYIVNNTVGKLVEGKTPKEVSNIKIVDPACGSGSFLIGAYQYLLDWHKHYYTNNGKLSKGKKDSPLTPEGALTTGEKKRILLNNIHGVDIDVNAVEVTKLSLLLKCMEGETQASIGYQLSMFNERVLPTLDNNIKDGNSLVDFDYYDGQLYETERRIKPFNWEKAFPEVFKVTKTDEERELFHITCVMHNTRISQRMVDFNVKTGQAEYLSFEEECELIKIIAGIVKEDHLRILALNLCADHLHFVIACNPEKLTGIVGKLKSVSAREFNVWRGITKPQEPAPENLTRGHAPENLTRGHAPENLTRGHGLENLTRGHGLENLTRGHGLENLTRGHAPLSKPDSGHAPLSKSDPGQAHENDRTRGDTQNSLWAQKFNRKLIDTNDQLNNTLDYIENNRIKHNLPPFPPEISDLILSILTPYEKAFEPEIIKGGFDVVIGNPPYVNLVSIPLEQRNYFQQKFRTCKNKSDLYSFFIEKACVLTKANDYKFSFIVPHTWLATESFELLRKKLLDEGRIESIAEMGFKVFDGVTVSTLILICSSKNNSISILNSDFSDRFNIPSSNWINDKYHIDLQWNPKKDALYKKIVLNTLPLEKIIQFSRGIKTSDDKRFISFTENNNEYKRVFRGRNIKSYSLIWTGEYIWYRPDLMKEKVGCLPHTKAFFEVPEKLITQRVNSSMQLLVAYDNFNNYFLDTTNVSRYDTWDKKHSMKYIAGLLNSKLINYWYCNKYKMPTIGLYELHSIPFKPIDFNNRIENTFHEEIIKLVDLLIKLNQEKSQTKLQTQISQIENKIDYCENRINEIVYQLYGLTDEEIKIVEGK